MDNRDHTKDFDLADVSGNKLMAVLSYLGFLILVPLIAGRKSPFVRYHLNQAIILDIVMIALSVINKVMRFILPFGVLNAAWGFIHSIITFIVFAVIVLQIIYAINGGAKDVPFIGGIRIIK